MVTERAAYAESGLIRKQTEDHLRAAPIRPVDYVIVVNEVPNQGGTAGYYVYSPLAVFSRGLFVSDTAAGRPIQAEALCKICSDRTGGI